MIKPWAVLVAITLTAAFFLGAVHEITKEPIHMQQANARTKALAILLPEAAEFIPVTDITAVPGVEFLYTGYRDGEIKGYILSSETNGYGGTVGLLAAIDINGAVRGINIYKSSETPGLGENIRAQSFTAQFAGANARLTVVKNEPKINEIHAITGATVSTSAVVTAVNAVIDYYINYLSSGGN